MAQHFLLSKTAKTLTLAQVFRMTDAEAETLRNEFIQATTMESRKAAVEKLHKRLWEVVPYIPIGQYLQPFAWRKNISGVLPTSQLVLWNISKD